MNLVKLREEEGKFKLEVNDLPGKTGEALNVSVEAVPEDITEPDIWLTLLSRNLRVALLRESGSDNIGSTEDLTKQVLAHAATRKKIAAEASFWGVGRPNVDAWLEKKGYVDQDTNQNTIIDNQEHRKAEITEPPIPPIPPVQPTKPDNAFRNFAFGLIGAGLIALLAYFLIFKETPREELVEKPRQSLEILRDSMSGLWTDCLVVTDKPGATLQSLINPIDYKIVSNNYDLKVEALITDYSLNQTPPVAEAMKYLQERKTNYEDLCGCSVALDCP